MPQNSTIRKALSVDLPLLDRIKPVHEAGYFEHCFQGQAQGARDILIVTLDGEDCGYGILNWKPRYALFKRLETPEIQDLNVLPDFRQRGAATALIKYCEDAARERGCEQIGIGVGLHAGFGPAQRLYVKLCYIPDGFGVVYDRDPVTPYELRPVDDDLNLMMVKDLSAS